MTKNQKILLMSALGIAAAGFFFAPKLLAAQTTPGNEDEGPGGNNENGERENIPPVEPPQNIQNAIDFANEMLPVKNSVKAYINEYFTGEEIQPQTRSILNNHVENVYQVMYAASTQHNVYNTQFYTNIHSLAQNKYNGDFVRGWVDYVLLIAKSIGAISTGQYGYLTMVLQNG